MKAVWQGAAVAPSVSATQYAFITSTLSAIWQDYESEYIGTAAVVPLSEAITVTKLTVWVTTAPGSGKSWTFTFRANKANTAASVTVSDTSTSASWSGSVSLSQLDIVALASVPSGTPVSPGNIYWTIEYTTAGNYYLIPGGLAGTNANSSAFYLHPIRGVYFSEFGASSSGREAVIPTAITVTRIAAHAAIGPAVFTPGAHSDFYVRNATTGVDSGFYVYMDGTTYSVSSISQAGSLSFAAGDRMVIKLSNLQSGWSAVSTCMTVVPGSTGEIIVAAYGHLNAPSSSATNYQNIAGSGSWNATESAVYERSGAGTIKNLYVWQTSAPSVGKSYAYTVRKGGSDTSLTASVSGTSTTANDTSNSFSAADGDFISVKSVPTGTPNATGALSISYVLAVPQSVVSPSVSGLSSITGISSITI